MNAMCQAMIPEECHTRKPQINFRKISLILQFPFPRQRSSRSCLEKLVGQCPDGYISNLEIFSRNFVNESPMSLQTFLSSRPHLETTPRAFLEEKQIRRMLCFGMSFPSGRLVVSRVYASTISAPSSNKTRNNHISF